MSAESIESSLTELIKLLRDRCPNLSPAIFPSRYTPKELSDLCNETQQTKIAEWMVSRGSPSLRYVTAIDASNGVICITSIHEANETDALLGNLESMMYLLTQGSDEEIEVAKERFLQVNGHAGDKDLERRVFVEAYNIAYAIKVLVSNMPMQLMVSKMAAPLGKNGKSRTAPFSASNLSDLLSLPLENDIKIEKLFDTIVQRATIESIVSNSKKARAGSSSDSDSDSNSEADAEVKKQSRSRRKRRATGKQKANK